MDLGIDIALVYDMDQPQANYFVNIASAMTPGSKIVLCCAKPGWYRAESEDESYRTLGYAVRIIANANKGLRIPLVLSGDAHHYARYAGNGREPQFITSGGGGAYLTGTSGLKPKLTLLKWPDEPQLEFKKCYPTEQESQELLKGNFLFFPANVGFSYLLATTYTMFAFLLTYAPRVDLTIDLWFLLCCLSRASQGTGRFTHGQACGRSCLARDTPYCCRDAISIGFFDSGWAPVHFH